MKFMRLEKIKALLYIITGKKPFGKGYTAYKNQEIKKVLTNNPLTFFQEKIELPVNYGYRIDERIVEYPWFFSLLSEKEGKLLDAGSILNFDFILEHKKLQNKKIFISTLAPENNCFWYKKVSYLYEDLRSTCYQDNYFDWIVCLSTLEHIGLDNTLFYIKEKSKAENKVNDYKLAIKEFKRILKPKGNIYLSFPYGAYKNHGWLQVFNDEMVGEILRDFAPEKYRIFYFIYRRDGWYVVNKNECDNATYFDIHQEKKLTPDFVAAAKSIVCLEMSK